MVEKERNNKRKTPASLQRKCLLLNNTYLRFIFPSVNGPFAICRAEYVGGVQRCTVLTVIQAGKVVLVLVALAYWLVSRCRDTGWWGFIVEEIEALGKIVADLSEDQSTKPG